MSKICKTCKESKSLDKFYSHGSCKSGTRTECKDCGRSKDIEKSKQYRLKNPEKRKSTVLMNKYGIGLEQYNEMLTIQNNVCKICKTSDPGPKNMFCVDHCHKTGKVRGLLCYYCNTGLGFLRDDIDNMVAAIAYLRESLDG